MTRTSRPSCDFVFDVVGLRVTWLAVAACFLGAGPVVGQSILQFDQLMRKIDRRSQSLQRNLGARDFEAALADAREVGELYQLMADYFMRRKGDSNDAVKLAKDGAALADAVIGSLQGEDFDRASRSAAAITGACRDCHVRYKPLEP